MTSAEKSSLQSDPGETKRTESRESAGSDAETREVSDTRTAGLTDPPVPEVLNWTAHPLKSYPVKSVVLVLVMVALGFMLYWWTGEVVQTLFWVVICFLFVARYFFPTRYTLSAEGVQIRFLGRTTTRRWEEFKNFYVHSTGAHLSPFSSPSALDPFRGHYLLFSGNKETVVAFLKRRIGRSG